jgi:HK97 family phage prohead protease
MSDHAAAAVEYKSVPCELKAAGEDRGRLSGRAAALHNIDAGRDIIAAGAFKADLSDPGRIFVGGLNHNWDQPIGRLVSAHESDGALVFESGPIVDTTHGQDVKKLIQAGIIDRASIGYKAVEFKHLNGPDEVKGYWKSVGYQPSGDDLERANGRIRLLTRLKLFEVSPVTIPMNDRAMISAVKFGGPGMYDQVGSYGAPHGPPGDLDDATDRVRDCVVGIFLDYLCMSLRFVVANDMVAPDDRLAIVGQTIDQTRDALLQHLRPILAADDSDDAAEDIAETLGDMSKQLKARLDLPGFDTKDFALVPGADFASHSRVVVSANEVDLAAVAAFVRRAESRSEARFKVGRELSQANIDEIDSVADSIEAMARGHLEHAGRLRTLTGKAKGKSAPVEPAFPAVPAAAGITPILMGGKSAVPASGSDAEPASPAGPDLSDYLAQFYATDPALTGIDVARP